MTSSSVTTIIADRGDAGVRIDRVITRRPSDGRRVSRTRVQALIADGQVTVNGTMVRRPSARAAAGDEIVVALPARPARRRMGAEPGAPLDVLYEDDDLLAVNKAAGLVVHPTFGHASGTLMNALLWYARAWPAGYKPALVGRLDKDTSGVLLVSKNPRLHAALQRATASGAADKRYLALVHGRVRPARGVIDLPLGRDPSDRRRTAVGLATGAQSLTRFERLAVRGQPAFAVSLVRCTLGSGRRHQIRAHLAARGWPIVGDPVYGNARRADTGSSEVAAALRAFPRQALHAASVTFAHPATGARVHVAAPLPDDLAGLLEKLRI